MQVLTAEQTTQFASAILMSGTLGQSGREGLLTTFAEKVIPKVTVTPTNAPDGDNVAPHVFEGGAKSIKPDPQGHRPAIDFLKPSGQAETKAPISIAYIGESHTFGLDNVRGTLLWNTFNQQKKGERLVIVERGMDVHKHYLSNIKLSEQPVVREEDMYPKDMQYHFAATEVGRSVQVGAYLFLCLAGGRQGKKSRVLILFGENHMKDVIAATEYFITNTKTINWVQKRARAYFTMTSQKG